MKWSLSALVLVLFATSLATSQEPGRSSAYPYFSHDRTSADIVPAAWQDDDDDDDDDEGSPSDRFGPRANRDPMDPSTDEPDAQMPIVDLSCDSYFGSCGCEGCASGATCQTCPPWKLLRVNGSRINVGGWLSGGVTYADHNVPTTAPVAFANPTDEVLLNQAWIYAERKAETGGCGTDWGFRIDYVFGADGPDTQAFGDRGWDFGWNTGGTGGNTYGSAIPQLYFELAYNDLSLKLGHFFTIIGYESVPSPNNFFYSHAYTMNYGEPFTHTGLLAEYPVHQHISVFGGYTFGWDSGFDNYLNAHTFLGGVDVQLADNVSVAYMMNWGDFGDGTANLNVASNVGDIYMQSLVAQIDLTCRLKYVVQSDYGSNYGTGAAGNKWYGLNQYLFYAINQKWGAGLRYEVFRDHATTSGRVTNNAETYQAWTMGANWRPTANVAVRPELRWDYVNNSTGPFGGQNSLFTFGVDAIFTF